MSDPTSARLDYAERWLLDGLQVLRPPFSALQVTADMTHATRRLEELRRDGVHATATHLLVQAAARALAANPTLHQLIAGTRRHRPSTVDIGLSVTGATFVAPVLVIESANTKSIADIAAEITRRAPEVREADRQMLTVLRRWGWVVPFGLSPPRDPAVAVQERRLPTQGRGNVSDFHGGRRLGADLDVCDVRRADRRADLVAGRRRRRAAGGPPGDDAHAVERSRRVGRAGRRPFHVGGKGGARTTVDVQLAYFSRRERAARSKVFLS